MKALTREEPQRVEAGEEALARQWIEEFHPRIYAYLRRLTGHDTEAADLTQRTFTQAWRSLPSFQGRSSPASWLHGIAYHLFVDWLRARRPTDERGPEWWAALPAEGPGPDELAASRDHAATVFAAVDRLEDELRDTLHLHYYQGLTIDETAEALGIASSTVKYRAREALSRLQRLLADESAPRPGTTTLTPPRRL